MSDYDAYVRNMKGVSVTVTVHVTREFRIRLWLSKQLFKLGAWVSGMDIVVQNASDDGHNVAYQEGNNERA